MTFSSASQRIVPAQIGQASGDTNAPHIQSRGAVDIVLEEDLHNVAVTSKESPAAKPWAHFVAGGYVLSSGTS